MDFDTAYEQFVKHHSHGRNGESAIRFQQGPQHAEKLFVEQVWWPAFHTFRDLYPEYEVRDFKEGNRYIDFAYIRPQFRIAIEIDGYGPHWKDVTPEQFSDNCIRQNHLVIDRWHVLRFAFTSVQSQPRVCQQTIQQLIGRLSGDISDGAHGLLPVQREILQLAFNSNGPISSDDILARMKISRPTARKHLKKLVELQWLIPATNKARVYSYSVHPSRRNTHWN